MVLIVGVGAVLVASWLLFANREGDSATDDVSAASASAEVGRLGHTQSARAAEPGRQAATISGLVRRNGQPVKGARVVLKGASVFATNSGADGTFSFNTAPGAVYLSASLNDAVSEVLGPLAIEAGGHVNNVVLDILDGVVVKGVVVDFVRREPIAKAVVTTSVGTAVTDEHGGFELVGPKSQTWVEVSAPGYLTRTEWVALEVAKAGARLELALSPASRVEGEVLVGGAPAERATVFVEVARGARAGERSLATVTDAAGKFAVECGDGRVVVVAVSREGARVKSPELFLAVGEKRTGLVLEANDVDSVGGVVTRAGAPLPNALVTVIDAKSDDVAATAVTALDGHFRTTPMVTGSYLVQVRVGSFVSVAGPFVHRLGGPPWAVDVKEGLTLSGRVEPPSGGIRVRCRSGDWAGPSAETVTDDSGRFAFEGVSAGLLHLDAEGPGGAATAQAHAGDEVVLRLSHGVVVVHLQDDSGAALTDGILFARSLDTGALRRFVVLAPDGSYRFELPTGPWALHVEVATRGQSAPVPVTVTSAGVDVRISLEPGIVVRGLVLDAQTKLPISGATLRVRSPDVAHETASVMTNARGEYATPPVPKSHGVTASAPGYRERGDAIANLNPSHAVWELTRSEPNDRPPRSESFEGIGMTLKMVDGRPAAAGIIEGSPAERAGVLVGDSILSVDGEPSGGDMNALVSRIRGPAGTEVRIGFQRAGRQFELVIRRRQISPM